MLHILPCSSLGFNLSFINREKKTSVSKCRAIRPAKRKAMLRLIESSSDEENISRPSPPRPQPAQQRKTTRSVHKQARAHYENTKDCQHVVFVVLFFYVPTTVSASRHLTLQAMTGDLSRSDCFHQFLHYPPFSVIATF